MEVLLSQWGKKRCCPEITGRKISPPGRVTAILFVGKGLRASAEWRGAKQSILTQRLVLSLTFMPIIMRLKIVRSDGTAVLTGDGKITMLRRKMLCNGFSRCRD